MCLVLFLVYMNLQVLHDSTGTKFRHNSRSWPELIYGRSSSGTAVPGYDLGTWVRRTAVPARAGIEAR